METLNTPVLEDINQNAMHAGLYLMLFQQFLDNGHVLGNGLPFNVSQGHLRIVQPGQELLQKHVAAAKVSQAVGQTLVALSAQSHQLRAGKDVLLLMIRVKYRHAGRDVLLLMIRVKYRHARGCVQGKMCRY